MSTGLLRLAVMPLMVVLCAAAIPARAASTVECHCFNRRTYDPANPGATDAFLLAASESSLLAAAHGVAKGDLVRLRMAGFPGHDLWVASHAASRLGRSMESLLGFREQGLPWGIILGGDTGDRLGAGLASALKEGADAGTLGTLVIEEVLTAGLGAPASTIEELQHAGATLRETILSVLLWKWTGDEPSRLLAAVCSGEIGWDSLLDNAGIRPDELEERVAALLK